eukprot:gnl/TRDRNA2_/TRDRNA2_192169_c0_seq1.p1 gnl/TRDRNA2_/TRDRNA2_192169_c0~~gnl/TRDRNA2_/TRDRNA2_192169_c0_seq1.p1  ORF type:complete len:197 (+),score=63.21 gnl/TRDRNA2_/TRDRNA2_192169_c0_seq1:61-651(+)
MAAYADKNVADKFVNKFCPKGVPEANGVGAAAAPTKYEIEAAEDESMESALQKELQADGGEMQTRKKKEEDELASFRNEREGREGGVAGGVSNAVNFAASLKVPAQEKRKLPSFLKVKGGSADGASEKKARSSAAQEESSVDPAVEDAAAVKAGGDAANVSANAVAAGPPPSLGSGLAGYASDSSDEQEDEDEVAA